MSTIPLPHAAIVQSIQSVQPFAPGDILMIQSATTQANIPVLVLGINKLDPTQFTLDTSTDPDTVKINTGTIVADPVWTAFTPTVSGVTTTAIEGRYLIKGKTVSFKIAWKGTLTAAAPLIQFATLPVARVGSVVDFVPAATTIRLPGNNYPAATSAIQGNVVYAVSSNNVNFPIAPTIIEVVIQGTYEAV